MDPSGYVFDPVDLTAENHAQYIRAENAVTFWENLTLQQQEWANSHSYEYCEMLEYMLDNFNAETKSFILEMITQMTGTDLSFDLDNSLKSPFFVDLTEVSGNSVEEIKFNQVYSKLLQSTKFKTLFNDLFEPTNFINAKFKIENIPQNGGPNVHQDGECTLFIFPNGNLKNEITIDRTALLTASDVEIATVILHECIHAFLNIKLRHPSIGMSVDAINDNDFTECINLNYNGFSGNQMQHSFMVDHMIPVMVEIFNEIKNVLITSPQIRSVEYPENGAAFIYQPLPNIIPMAISDIQIPWNWNGYFTHLSFEGLQFCTAYPTIYPSGSVAEFIRNQYIRAGHAMFQQ